MDKTQDMVSEASEGTVSDLLAMWMNIDSIRRKSSSNYKYIYLIRKHLLPGPGKMPLSQVNAAELNRFLDDKVRKEGLAPSYVATLAIILRSALKLGSDEGLCKPVWQNIHRPAPVKREIVYLSADQQKELEHYLQTHPSAVGCGIQITLNCGLRVGEVCALSWDDVDFGAGILHVRHTISRQLIPGSEKETEYILGTPKTGSSARDIPINSALMGILQRRREREPGDFVCGAGASFLHPPTFEYRYHRIMENAGVPPINYHALRHTFATRCIERGMDPKTLSELLGHSGVGITMNTYVHSNMDRKRKLLEELCRTV